MEAVVSDQEWISCAEAASILHETEEVVAALVRQGGIRGKYENGVYLINKKHLLAWDEQRKKPRVEVAKIYSGIRRTLLEHHKTIYAKEQAQHPGVRGTLHENLVRDFLRGHLPQRYYLGAGQVISSNPVMDDDYLIQDLSRQIDIVVFDGLNHPILLPRYELYPIEGTLAVIEVKSHLNKRTLVGTKKNPGALPNIKSAKRLVSSEAQSFLHPPFQIEIERVLFDLREIPSPLGVVFAFSSISPRTLAGHWAEWNNAADSRHRVDIICLLERSCLLIDTNRFPRLLDTHQISTVDPVASAGANKIVCIESPAILFFFFNLLLRDLRKMSMFTQKLTATTPSSYLHRVSITCRFVMDNALDPHTAGLIEFAVESNGDEIEAD
jgi:hypothetical protein